MDILFFKVWRNVYIRKNINRYKRLMISREKNEIYNSDSSLFKINGICYIDFYRKKDFLFELPEGVLCAKESRLAIAKAAKVWIHYITAASNDISPHSGRSTTAPKDVLQAIEEVDFESFKPQLEKNSKVKKKEKEKKMTPNQKKLLTSLFQNSSWLLDYICGIQEKIKYLVDQAKQVLRVLLVFTPLPFFWALYDQTGTRSTTQGNIMDRRIGSITMDTEIIGALNPLIFVPIFEYCLYRPIAKKV
ncbi:hypothetical protein ACTFIU_010161 [Dictyostelium citrinum]